MKRRCGLKVLPPCSPGIIKGTAVCYNATTNTLVSFSAPQRLLSIQLAHGAIRSTILDAVGSGSAHKPLLASTDTHRVVLAAFDGVLQVSQAGDVAHLPKHYASSTTRISRVYASAGPLPSPSTQCDCSICYCCLSHLSCTCHCTHLVPATVQ